MTEKAATPAKKRVRTTKPTAERRIPDHGEISERAYYIYLEEGGTDTFANWLRAERELMAA
ncbi:MAG: DUF2934 domain-containing protein [Solirubrobacteraceae bacterium]